jgi:chromosome segregation ATPase
MTNPNDDDLPRITLDEEDRRGYQQKNSPNASKGSNKSTRTIAPAQSNGGSGLATFALLVALASGSGAGYLYWQLQQQTIAANAAEARIQELENKLSATGEEMGESTVALQVKVTELSNRAEELWGQMDKLWASAWRRNQKEITELGEKLDDEVASLKSTTSALSSSSNSTSQTLTDIRAQTETMASELLAINVQLERASANSGSNKRDVQQATEKLRLLEQRNAAMVTRVNQIENEIRDLATRMASSGGTP